MFIQKVSCLAMFLYIHPEKDWSLPVKSPLSIQSLPNEKLFQCNHQMFDSLLPTLIPLHPVPIMIVCIGSRSWFMPHNATA